MNKLLLTSMVAISITMSANVVAEGSYSEFPVTVKDYSGDATTSVKYTGQAARLVLHDSLKALIKQADGTENPELNAQLMAYFEGKGEGRDIIEPSNKDGFKVKQTKVDDISGDKNLAGKAYQGAIAGWPGNMTGPEVIKFMLEKAVTTDAGYDPITGYDYQQLVSKFTMGAVFYNQAVDNYLDELLEADKKPNNKPYKEGTAYTGKEHVWDEAFGYFGAPAHVLSLSAEDAYNIAKGKPEGFAKADYNKDGVIDLKTEMVYGHAYYASGFDKSGKTTYLNDIATNFFEGRKVISEAKGEALTQDQLATLKNHAADIEKNWEKVIAEAVFKYAGSTYKDLNALKEASKNKENPTELFRTYVKHWGELKGFSLALQTGKNNLGATAAELNKLIGFGPVLLGDTQVSGIDKDGNYLQGDSVSMDEYMLNMLKIQKLVLDTFGVEARDNDALAGLTDLADKLGSSKSAEND